MAPIEGKIDVQIVRPKCKGCTEFPDASGEVTPENTPACIHRGKIYSAGCGFVRALESHTNSLVNLPPYFSKFELKKLVIDQMGGLMYSMASYSD